MTSPLSISFHGGTIRLHGLSATDPLCGFLPSSVRWDEREAVHRLPAVAYAELVLCLRGHGVAVTDEARVYRELSIESRLQQEPFPHQREAMAAWEENGSRGVVVLPTGSGKTFVATLAIARKRRSTLVVVPTIDLLNQWYDVLRTAFDIPIGILGGGYHEVLDVTVTTYDSAYLHMERLGNRFGLVIFDECHHLPSPSYAMAARMCLAPYRLGLTATPERPLVPGVSAEDPYSELIGPLAYRKDITELTGEYLSSYETARIEVALTTTERAEYEEARAAYLSFVRRMGIRMSSPAGFGEFVLKSSQSDEGRLAFAAYRRQRGLAMAAPGKLDVPAALLRTHRADRTILFTQDNATVYAISRQFLLPAITHQTKVKERSAILSGLRDGTFVAIVTSKVLNEGVNVPDANVAVVLSGSGSVREHVQRLGRILRKKEGKRAILYELIAQGTSEERTSDKRREHIAYQ